MSDGSRIDRLSRWLARPAADTGGGLSRRTLLARAAGAAAVVAIPVRLAEPTTAQAEGYCAAQCLNDANAAHDARLTKCFVSAFGTDIPDKRALTAYVAAKIGSGGLGALVLINEIFRADGCGVANELLYSYQAGQCGEPKCGNATKYPPPAKAKGGCSPCTPGSHCCVCNGYPGTLIVNGTTTCAQYCSVLTPDGVASDTVCPAGPG